MVINKRPCIQWSDILGFYIQRNDQWRLVCLSINVVPGTTYSLTDLLSFADQHALYLNDVVPGTT